MVNRFISSLVLFSTQIEALSSMWQAISKGGLASSRGGSLSSMAPQKHTQFRSNLKAIMGSLFEPPSHSFWTFHLFEGLILVVFGTTLWKLRRNAKLHSRLDGSFVFTSRGGSQRHIFQWLIGGGAFCVHLYKS